MNLVRSTALVFVVTAALVPEGAIVAYSNSEGKESKADQSGYV